MKKTKKMIGLTLAVMSLCSMSIYAQNQTLYLDFENLNPERREVGVQGFALNLEDVEDRSYVSVAHPVLTSENFTAHVWAKVNKFSQKDYTIVSNITPLDTLNHHWKPRITQFKNKQYRVFEGWKVGVQENGAWYFVIQNGNAIYEYYPTIKQNIRDDQWHLISVTYNKEKEEVGLYLDGEQKALINVRSLKNITFSDTLVIGNSAEYFEDKTISNEWETFYGLIDEVKISSEVSSFEDIKSYFKESKKIEGTAEEERTIIEELKVVAFNIWDGGNHTGKEVGKKRLIELLRKEDADLYTLVETYGSGAEIADELGFYYYLVSSNLSVLSRYPIEDTFVTTNSFLGGGAKVVLPNGQRVNVMSIWISHLPGFRDQFSQKGADVAQFLAEDYKTRGRQLEQILAEIKPLIANADQEPLILGGDFNSGSHLDWTEKAAKIHNNYVVRFNASSMMEKQNFVDSYREVHPDEILDRGYTWSPFYTETKKERIDYIYYKGKKMKAIESKVIEYHKAKFPSDHAGISTTFKLVY